MSKSPPGLPEPPPLRPGPWCGCCGRGARGPRSPGGGLCRSPASRTGASFSPRPRLAARGVASPSVTDPAETAAFGERTGSGGNVSARPGAHHERRGRGDGARAAGTRKAAPTCRVCVWLAEGRRLRGHGVPGVGERRARGVS